MIYDVAVIGGGPAGAAFAAAMARAGARVVLFDAARQRRTIGEVLDPTVEGSLRYIAALDRFLLAGFVPVPNRAIIWNDDEVRDVPGILNPHGESRTVDRQTFDTLLVEHASQVGVVRVSQRCTAAILDRGGWSISTGVHDVKASLLVQAQGRSAALIGCSSRHTFPGDDSFAAIAHLPAQHRDDSLCVERTSTGWWYSLRLPPDRAVVCCVLPRALIRCVTANLGAWWSRELRDTRMMRAYADASLDGIRVIPAYGSIREEICGERWCCIGDAAATYDPLTGQGVAAALAKGVALSRLLSEYSPQRAFSMYADTERSTFSEYGRARSLALARSLQGSQTSAMPSAISASPHLLRSGSRRSSATGPVRSPEFGRADDGGGRARHRAPQDSAAPG